MKLSTVDVFLYYPNLIGYGRILFMMTSFYFAMRDWRVTIICYLLAFAGDAIDGYVARKFNQSMWSSAVVLPNKNAKCIMLQLIFH